MMDGMDTETGEIIRVEMPRVGPYRWSQPCDKIFAALAKAQGEIKNAVKDSTNPHYRSTYADLASIREACWEALTKNGICPVQMPVNGEGSNIGVVTVFGHSSGQWIESTIYVAPTKFDAQGVGSVITYLRRYALAAMAGVAPEDDDGNAAVGRPSENASAAQRVQGTPRATLASTVRSNVAAAPSEAKTAASARVKEMQEFIARAETVPDARSLDGCPAWLTMEKMVRDTASSPAGAETVFTTLRNKIEDRVAYLEDAANV